MNRPPNGQFRRSATRILPLYLLAAVVLAIFYVVVNTIDVAPETRGILAVSGFFAVAIPWFIAVIAIARRGVSAKDQDPAQDEAPGE